MAGTRWPFELLQNALDAGPRSGHNDVNILLSRQGDHVVFEHNGAPFTSQELAALLSGGSSKDFGSEKTTGRFGTGFLVTHVLAEHVTVDGVLEVGSGYEQFHLVLERGGEEDDILANIERCDDAIAHAEALASLEEIPSARFEYGIDLEGTLALGLQAFRSALPYLFGTSPSLGEVRLDIGDVPEVWRPGSVAQSDLADARVWERAIHVEGSRERTLRIVRVEWSASGSAALVLLEHESDGGWEVITPADSSPRIFRQYPLGDSGFLPISFVLDGRFEPDQERGRVLMGAADREELSDALRVAVLGVEYGLDQGWNEIHRLAHADRPTNAFDSTDSDEVVWWRAELRSLAERLARLSIVKTTKGSYPALSDGAEADFVAPRLLDEGEAEETSVERMWRLASKATHLLPPVLELATEWSAIADGWGRLGLQLSRILCGELGALRARRSHFLWRTTDRWRSL